MTLMNTYFREQNNLYVCELFIHQQKNKILKAFNNNSLRKKLPHGTP